MLKQLDEQTANLLDRRYRATATILFAQIIVLIILTVVSVLIAGRVQPFGAITGESSFSIENLTNPNVAGGVSTVTTFLWIAILAVAVSAFLLRRVILAPAALRDTATIKGASGLLQSLQTKTVLLATTGGLIAVLGFVISLISGDYSDMIRAALVATIIFLINFPRKSSWSKLAQAAAS